MKRLFYFLFLFIVAISSYAYDFQVDDLYYNIRRGSRYVVEVSGAVKSITITVIPDTVIYNSKSYKVVGVSENAFRGCSSLTSITIPSSVTSIGDAAFSGCSSLTSITIPESVTSIGNNAFYDTGIYNDGYNWEDGVLYISNCLIASAVTSIKGDYTIKENTRLIADKAFWRCYSLTSVTIPNSVTSIGNYAFCECENLTAIAIPNSVTSIGDGAFSYCSSLTSITIPNSVTSIGEYTFSGCPLTSITIPNSVTSIGDGVFSDCTLLASIAVESGNTRYDSRNKCNAIINTANNILIAGCKNTIIPNNVTSIGDAAFSGCSSLTSITIPESVTRIGNATFSGCSSLTSITIPESVTSIGGRAFHWCPSMTSVTVGDSVTSIGDWAFFGCHSLTSVIIPNSVTSIGDLAFFNCTFTKDNFINNSILDAIQHQYWGAKIVDVEMDGLLISNNTIIDCRTAKDSITIPNSVTSIGDYAFEMCTDLTSITIPNSVTSIGSFAFNGCGSLTSITTPNSVTSIREYAFGGCVFIEENFINRSSLDAEENKYWGAIFVDREIDGLLVNNDTVILCRPNARSVVIPDGITRIRSRAFSNCSELTSITIPNSVISIGASAFYGCKSLISVALPNSITKIDGGLFYGCSALQSVVLSENIVSLSPDFLTTSDGYGFFEQCSSLTSITIPRKIQFIGSKTFKGCHSLKTIYVQALTPPNIGDYSAILSKPMCYIPCGTTAKYINSDWSNLVSNFEEHALRSYSGQCGDNLYWTYDNTKLSIIGTGAMYDCSYWELLKDSIVNIEIANGVTYISEYAFSNIKNLTKIILPASLDEIGANAFSNCRRLYEIYSYAAIPPLAEMSSFTNYNATLYVPCEDKQYYQSDMVFSRFSNIECIGAENAKSDSIVIVPGSDNVTITWLTDENAESYTIVITKDVEVVCTLTFNADGQLLNIAFALGRNGNHPAQYAAQTVDGYRFTVTGLTEATQYAYSITTKDASNKTIASYIGEFTTKSNTPTGVSDVLSPTSDTQKLLHNGQLLILRDGKIYTVMGQEVK